MTLAVKTTIRNMGRANPSDWEDEDDYKFLVAAWEFDWECTVDNKAGDGYFDVTFVATPAIWPPKKIAALSWYHLDGFTVNGPEL